MTSDEDSLPDFVAQIPSPNEENPLTHKFSIQLFDHLAFMPRFPEFFSLGEGAELRSGSPKILFNSEELKHWKKWLGTLQWEQFERSSAWALLTMATDTPEIIDVENTHLANNQVDVLLALILTRPLGIRLEPQILTGSGEYVDSDFHPRTVRTVSKWDDLFRMYVFEQRSNNLNEWFDELQNEKNMFTKWAELFSLLQKVRQKENPRYSQMDFALQSFWKGMQERDLNFRIPGYVRAAECLAALPKGQGAENFADRTIKFISTNKTHPVFLDPSTLHETLKNLYKIRNDGVHGKPFAWQLRKLLGDQFESAIPLYDYVAETAARSIIVEFLKSPSHLKESVDRDQLEDAWTSSRI